MKWEQGKKVSLVSADYVRKRRTGRIIHLKANGKQSFLRTAKKQISTMKKFQLNT